MMIKKLYLLLAIVSAVILSGCAFTTPLTEETNRKLKKYPDCDNGKSIKHDPISLIALPLEDRNKRLERCFNKKERWELYKIISSSPYDRLCFGRGPIIQKGPITNYYMKHIRSAAKCVEKHSRRDREKKLEEEKKAKDREIYLASPEGIKRTREIKEKKEKARKKSIRICKRVGKHIAANHSAWKYIRVLKALPFGSDDIIQHCYIVYDQKKSDGYSEIVYMDIRVNVVSGKYEIRRM